MNGTEFDLHADTYDADLNQALAASGEDKNYFARRRVQWVARCLSILRESPFRILDYGCGIGDTSRLLQAAFQPQRVVGVDISRRSIHLASARNATETCQFMGFEDYTDPQSMDLAYCNGVFHHIPVAERDTAAQYIFHALRPGGLLSLWENNPWNPGTRYVMSQCVFDRDAVTIAPPHARRLLQKNRFEIVRTDYCFFFPHILGALRFMETKLSCIPFGAQYQILCRRPSR
jgi:SAM-dependent methyltransferase